MMKLSANEIRRIRSLAQKKYRDEYGLFVVEGEKLVKEAMYSSFEIESIYRAADIGEEAMSRISMLSSPSPVLATVRKPRTFISGSSYPDTPVRNGLYLGLDSLRDPGNLGTILRIADWFGIDGIFAQHDTVDVFNPKTVQATMGAIFRVDFRYADLAAAVRDFIGQGGTVYGTFMDGENIYNAGIRTGNDSPVMIVIGNEANGISAEIAGLVTGRLSIPPYPAGEPGSESLNAAVATAITVAEFRRRLVNP